MSTYYIRAEYSYYFGTYGAPTDGPLCDHAGNRLEFASRDDAAAYLCEEADQWGSDAMGCERNPSGRYSFAGSYYLRHGEHARPVYRIRKVRASKAEGSK
tara:strand:- start:1207 stop:1506 length:300 start_codon:yes stop_codon:yes gene_type:complete